jgi:hypothetical protein
MRSALRSTAAAIIAACALASGCTKTESTSVVVELYTTSLTAGADLDQVTATVKGRDPVSFELASPAAGAKVDFPIRFGVTPAASDDETVTLAIVGRLRGADRLTTSARFGFVRGETRLLRLRLDRECMDHAPACAAGLACLAGTCTSDQVDVTKLPAYVPSPVVDAGPKPQPQGDAASDRAEAAPDAPRDATSQLDASSDLAGQGGADGPAACADGTTRACSCGVMAGGQQACAGGKWGACTISCDATGMKGTCGPGTRTCDEAAAHWGECSVPPAAADTCAPDNDDNCNGLANEGCTCVMGQTRTCDKGGLFGACAKGTQTCDAAGKWSACTIKPALADTCEAGNDDNCNGVVNEKCPCINGKTRPCSDGGLFGKCAAGTQTCAGQAWGACTITPAAADTCAPDNDDNCNGKPNESCACVAGQTRTCATGGLFGKCAAGNQTCDSTGKWSACSIAPAAADTCAANNDDNCNGKVNEGCACITGQSRPCSDAGAKGKCAGGTQACDGAGKWGACSIAPAAADTCAAGDDSTCNGTPNEGCACLNGQTRACSAGGAKGTCAGGTQTCGNGAWGACSVAPAAADSCAPGNDDTCNGTPNEGCACTNGSTRLCSAAGLFGKCAGGSETCAAGKWGACSITPSASDTCVAGNDDNCNGAVNEGCACTNGQTRACSAGGLFGKCANGTQTCGGGSWGACSITPSGADTCDANNDDNCNGKANEGCGCLNGQTRLCSAGGLSGKCANGNQTCGGGSWGACSITPSASDTCVAGNDDNCNGTPNQGCACLAGATRCASGPERRQTCDSAGAWQTVETCVSGAVCQSNGAVCLKQDGVACTAGSQCLSGICSTYYADADHDGYGDANSPTRVCGTPIPSGYTADSTDCCDGDANAYPGQTSYFDVPRATCGGFDYNCDGSQTKLLATLASLSCDLTFHTCNFYNEGWSGSVPDCGLKVNWITSCTYTTLGPTPSCAVTVKVYPSQPVQQCR